MAGATASVTDLVEEKKRVRYGQCIIFGALVGYMIAMFLALAPGARLRVHAPYMPGYMQNRIVCLLFADLGLTNRCGAAVSVVVNYTLAESGDLEAEIQKMVPGATSHAGR
jgi:hypothetical protein